MKVTNDMIPMAAHALTQSDLLTMKDMSYLYAKLGPRITAELKMDGDRRLLAILPSGITLTGRRLSVKDGNLIDKYANVPHLLEDCHAGVKEVLAAGGAILDGEMIIGDEVLCKSRDVARIMGCSPDKAVMRGREGQLMRFVVFDCIFHEGNFIDALPLSSRRGAAAEVVSVLGSEYIDMAPSTDIRDIQTAKQFYHSITSIGGEGIMLKSLESTYSFNSRSHSWLKVKRMETFDVVITGFQAAKELTKKKGATEATKSRIAGSIGAIEYGLYVDGKLEFLGTVSGFSDDDRAFMETNKAKLIGTVIEVEGQEINNGVIRHPRFLRFRDDKNATDCTLEVTV